MQNTKKLNKAIFLDRDGIINFDEGYVTSLKDFRILPGVFETVKQFQDKGYLLIIISNQGGVSRKLYKQENVEEIHEHLLNEFQKYGIKISEIYYCIHHPLSDSGKCICRKPDSLMLEKAIARFNVDKSKSYFIGDKDTDMQAAEKAGVIGVQMETNASLKNVLFKIQ